MSPGPRNVRETPSTRSERRSEPVGNPDDPGSPIQTVFYASGPSGYVGRIAAIGLCGILALLLMALTVSAGTSTAVAPRPLASPAGALLVTFDIQVDAGAADYVHRAAQAAIASNQDLVIVMNTPGGLLSNMVQIINATQEVQNHGLAVYTFVPPAAFAASAGSYIALASDAVYMANGSLIGPSTPYIIGGDPSQIQHVQEIWITLMRFLAQTRGYNITAAVDMAQNNTTYTGVEAAKKGLVTGTAETPGGRLAKGGLRRGPAGTYLLAYNVGYSPSPYGITQYVILGGTGAALVVAFLYLTRIRKALMAQPKLIDPTRIVNMTGRAATDLVPGKDGVANVGAEDWTAQSDQFIPKGTLIRVTGYGDGKIQVTVATPEGPEPPKSNEPSPAPPSSP